MKRQPQPWDREATEQPSTYKLFLKYRDAGERRSTRLLAEESGLSMTQVQRHCSRHRWIERCAAWDRHVQELSEAAERRELEARAGTWAKRAEELRQREFAVAQDLLATGEAILAKLRDQPGTLAEAAKAIELGSRLARLAAEMRAEPQEAATTTQVGVVVQLPSQKEPDEIDC